MDEMSELKPCPFCGGTFVLVKIEEKWGQKPEATYQCDQCGKHVITKTLKTLPVNSRESALLARAEKAEAMVERMISLISYVIDDMPAYNADEWQVLVAEWEHRNDKQEAE